MISKSKKILAGSLIIFTVIGFMIYSGMKDTTVYYLTINEFLSNEEKYKNEGVRISGKVIDGSIVRDESGMHVVFELIDKTAPDKKVKVDYRGMIPDTFKPNIDVVVEGKFSPERIFYAKVLLAKCPSKYEEKK
ncbi:cytochrome c maturation protein CcmE [Candidatus Poribacteria bacterium]|nr:cytochrome c maturation protein CcmE [Candidatus Poribacteria bacterium]